jgi:hypothetical protein
MIDLKKQDNVADAVNEILQQEALKGNQGEIDANNNGKVDREDFKILRDKKKVKEEIDMNDRTKDTLVGREKTKQKDDVGPNSNAKVSKFKLKTEESEQIDELSINTLTRVKSAATSAASDASREGDEGKATKRYDLAGKASNKIETKNRAAGLKPSGQHAFEEVEQIDELSKDTLGSYLDKKKSEYMKGKTQSGSKENAKDIQNMGKAHDKMKKEETQFNDHEKGAAQRLRDMRKNEKEAEKMDKQYQAMRNKKTLKQMKERLEEPVLDELINEVMSKDASAGDWIHDFVHSDNPKFAGKSKAKRKEMALAAYYSKKNEEAVNEGLKDMAKKTFKALTGGSDKDHLDRLKKDMYGGSEVKYAAKTLVKHAKDPLGLKKEEVEQIGEGGINDLPNRGMFGTDTKGHYGVYRNSGPGDTKLKIVSKHKTIDSASKHVDKLRKKSGKDDHYYGHLSAHQPEQGKIPKHFHEEFVEEGWDDMVKAAQEKVKSGPKPSGGSGKKEGSRYGGSKQKEKPEQDVKEGKDPMMDAGVGSQPNFVTDSAKPMQHAQSLAKKSLAKMRSDMMAKKSK